MDTVQTAYSMHRISKFFFVALLWGPLIVLPIIAYRWSDWWLLAGFPIALIGGALALKKRAPFLFGLALPVVGYWWVYGFSPREYPTFFLFCLSYGFICGVLAYGYQAEAVKVFREVKASEVQE